MPIEYIDINRLIPHPQNPRIALRPDVISAIIAGLANGFDESHAMVVRPLGDVFQIISGHHRLEAAFKVGIEFIPCWVKEMDEEAGYMGLASYNSHGEWLPLEYGLHALRNVSKARGKKGEGIKAYAEVIGREVKLLHHWIAAAKVYEYFVNPQIQEAELTPLTGQASSRLNEVHKILEQHAFSKHTFLDEIGKAPEEAWEALVLLTNDVGINVGKIRLHVKLIKTVMAAIPDFMFPKDKQAIVDYKKMLIGMAVRKPVEADKRISVLGEVKRLGETLGVVQAVVYTDSGEVEL